jgi:hypothetical protein
MRDHNSGTWFIQSLVQVFKEHAHEKELIDLLRKTSEALSAITCEEGMKQTCNVEMRHLYKVSQWLDFEWVGNSSELIKYQISVIQNICNAAELQLVLLQGQKTCEAPKVKSLN